MRRPPGGRRSADPRGPASDGVRHDGRRPYRRTKGAPSKRRTVLMVHETDWAIDVLDDWIANIRPQLSPGRHPALWVTERVGRLSPRSINEAFVACREAASLDRDSDLDCLRHSYITHLTEFGYPARFVQEQVGPSHASTTAIYMGVSNEYRNTLLEASMRNRLGDTWDVTSLGSTATFSIAARVYWQNRQDAVVGRSV